jgi:RimJ/RimL family protein N-acetyltransferase
MSATVSRRSIGLLLFLPEILPAVEIGWRLRREHWGQGYATEAATEPVSPSRGTRSPA